VASFIVFFLLFILPFVVAPFGITQFENPKVVFAEAVIILLFLVSIFNKNNASHANPRHILQITIYIIIVLITILDLLFFKTQLSFFGNPFRMQGIFMLWMLLIFSFLSGSVSFEKIEGRFHRVASFFNTILTSSWIFCLLLYSELFLMFFLPLNPSQRYVGTLGEPNALAAYALFLWPFGWFRIKQTSRSMIYTLLILFPVIIILYLSSSRSGMIAFGIELLFIFLQSINISLVKNVIICLIIYVISYIFPFFEHVPYENRVEVWQSAFYAGVINPALGNGFGNTETSLHNAAAGINLPIQYYYVDSSHNIFLDWWVQGGVIGVTVLLLLVYLSFFYLIKQSKKRELVLLLGMITTLSFNPASIVGLLGFWWIIGRSFNK